MNVYVKCSAWSTGIRQSVVNYVSLFRAIFLVYDENQTLRLPVTMKRLFNFQQEHLKFFDGVGGHVIPRGQPEFIKQRSAVELPISNSSSAPAFPLFYFINDNPGRQITKF